MSGSGPTAFGPNDLPELRHLNTLVLGPLALQRVDERPRTDDAFLTADLVHVAPEVGGRIVELRVIDNQHVEKGDVLFVIDQEPYRFKVEEAKGKIAMPDATLANQTRHSANDRSVS